MYQKKLEKDIRCPLEYGLSVFGGKWKSRIICVLAAKETLRYNAWNMVRPSRSATIPINDKCRTPILISECGIDIRLNSPLIEFTFLIF